MLYYILILGEYKVYFFEAFKLILEKFRSGNGAGSGQVAPIPTPPHLLNFLLLFIY